jgi:hypothetical protein
MTVVSSGTERVGEMVGKMDDNEVVLRVERLE